MSTRRDVSRLAKSHVSARTAVEEIGLLESRDLVIVHEGRLLGLRARSGCADGAVMFRILSTTFKFERRWRYRRGRRCGHGTGVLAQIFSPTIAIVIANALQPRRPKSYTSHLKVKTVSLNPTPGFTTATLVLHIANSRYNPRWIVDPCDANNGLQKDPSLKIT
jgi:hypothetical protein